MAIGIYNSYGLGFTRCDECYCLISTDFQSSHTNWHIMQVNNNLAVKQSIILLEENLAIRILELEETLSKIYCDTPMPEACIKCGKPHSEHDSLCEYTVPF